MIERWRCFVAVPLGDELRIALAQAVDAWRKDPRMVNLRWTDPYTWHVTLTFLGSVDPASVAAVQRAVESVAAAHQPMSARTGGLGAFPSAARGRVLWYGVDRSAALDAAVTDLRASLAVDAAQPFRAHVTLARSRGESIDLGPFLSEFEAPAGTLAVDRLQLMRSRLGDGPSRYEVLATAGLGVPAGV